MPIQFDKLFIIIKERGRNEYYLRKNGISASILDKIKKGGHIDTRTIEKLCRLLECQPSDIMEYVEDDEQKEGE